MSKMLLIFILWGEDLFRQGVYAHSLIYRWPLEGVYRNLYMKCNNKNMEHQKKTNMRQLLLREFKIWLAHGSSPLSGHLPFAKVTAQRLLSLARFCCCQQKSLQASAASVILWRALYPSPVTCPALPLKSTWFFHCWEWELSIYKREFIEKIR